jgi:uncharacterized protein YciI
MSYFAVTRDAGPGWTPGKGAFEQPGVEDHTAFMGSLATDGFLRCAGPVAGTEHDRIRVLLIVDADDAVEVRNRFDPDPWSTSGHLEVTSVEAWNVIVGGDRL